MSTTKQLERIEHELAELFRKCELLQLEKDQLDREQMGERLAKIMDRKKQVKIGK